MVASIIHSPRALAIFKEAKIVVEAVTQIAVRILFIIGTILMAAALLPVSFHAVVIPFLAIGASFLSAFFFVKQQSAVEIPPIPLDFGKPVSIEPKGFKNWNDNCWAHALFHLLEKDPNIRLFLRRKSGHPLLESLRSIFQKIDGLKAPLDIHFEVGKLREALHFSKSSQEDASKALVSIFNLLPRRLKLGLMQLQLSFGEGGPNLQKMVDENLKSNVKKAATALHIQIKRWDDQGKKITEDLNVPEILEIDMEGVKKKYRLASAVSHLGSETKSGHYVACRVEGGKKFICDDATVTLANLAQWNQTLAQSYLLCYLPLEEG
jgi:hypothetical protein